MTPTGRPDFIDSLARRLSAGLLPGPAAHLRMAHAVRRIEPPSESTGVRQAGVLITFFEHQPEDWRLIVIRRTAAHGRDKHAGQIAFPGGKRDRLDPDLMFTALREAGEEVALDLRHVDVLGPLSPLFITISKFMVHPFVAYTPNIPVLRPQAGEIDEILELPLRAFLDPSVRRETRIRLHAGMVLNHVPAFVVHEQVIWGATAMIISELLEILPAPFTSSFA